MKKLIIPIVFGLFLYIQPEDLFAKTICFAGSGGATGQFLYLSGGKIDEKPFAGNWFLGTEITVPTWGAIIASPGNIQLSWCSPHGPSSSSFCASVSGATTAALSGQYDNGQNGSFDGAVSISEVNCNTIPTAKPQEELAPGTMGALEKPEE